MVHISDGNSEIGTFTSDGNSEIGAHEWNDRLFDLFEAFVYIESSHRSMVLLVIKRYIIR